MSEAKIRTLFETRLKTWADDLGYPVAYENVNFDITKFKDFDPASGIYLRAYLLPARTDDQFLEGGHRERVGVFQVSICSPRGVGPQPAEAVASALSALFPTNLYLTDDSGFSVQVTTPVSAASGLQGENAWIVPTSFRYRADTT